MCANPFSPEPKFAYSLREIYEGLSISRDQLTLMVKRGEIDTITIGKRRLVPADAIEAYIAGRKAVAIDAKTT